jgi:hypothetical protein
MRRLGITLLLVGFLWIAWDGTFDCEARYSTWIWHSKNLPEGDLLSRTQVSNAMKDMSLSLYRLVLLPALVMLAGGLMIAFSSGSARNAKTGD